MNTQEAISIKDKIIAFHRALAVAELAALFDLCEATIYRRARFGRYPFLPCRYGGTVRSKSTDRLVRIEVTMMQQTIGQ